MLNASVAKETGRIEFFSDGVFAISMTLLVLAVKVPAALTLDERGLGMALLDLWPHYLAFVTAFLTIFAIWVNHHRIFTFVQKTDHCLLYWNGLLLLLITFLPFPTALLAEYLQHAEGTIASAVFTGTLISVALTFKGLWRYACKHKLIRVQDIDANDIKQITRQHRHGPILYFVAFVTAFFSANISVVLSLGLAVYIGFKGWPQRTLTDDPSQ